jgi:enoyl-CoA hydratase
MTEYSTILVDRRGAVTLITLNRPEALNALSSAVMEDLIQAFAAFEADETQRCAVLTGAGPKAFAAGADIKEMADKPGSEFFADDLYARWQSHLVAAVRKPWIAAVNGFALGGGCEVAMMCDIVIAADNARFGQPEIKLGIIPGAGGTQRLPRAVGKAKAMDLVLTARMMDAAEAERAGLVSRVVAAGELLDTALAVAETICGLSGPSVRMAKEAVNRAFEVPLSDGVAYERHLFHSLFATEDKSEGMTAFLAKRKPEFKHR